MAIRGVTFDWWGTIAVIPPQEEASVMRDLRLSRLESSLRRRGIPVDRSRLLAAYDRQGDRIAESWARDEELTPAEQVDEFLRVAGIDSRDDGLGPAIGDAIAGAILVHPPAFFPHVAPTLQRLADEGLAIGLISNTGRTWGRYLTELQASIGIESYFQSRVYSDELRVRKPNPRMFRSALKGLRLRPEEVVHVGDDAKADVVGATAIGMRAIWFETGYWPEARPDHADATIRDHADLPAALEALR